MTVHQLPFTDNRLAAVTAAPVDALALVEAAIERTDTLAALIRAAAPAPEITAAAEAVRALRTPLASLRLTVNVFAVAIEAYRAEAFAAAAGQRPYRRSRNRAQMCAVPGGPQDRDSGCAIGAAPDGGQAPGGAALWTITATTTTPTRGTTTAASTRPIVTTTTSTTPTGITVTTTRSARSPSCGATCATCATR